MVHGSRQMNPPEDEAFGHLLSMSPTPSPLTCHYGFVLHGAGGSNGALSSHSHGQHWQEPAGHPGGRQGPVLGSRQLPSPAPGTAAGTSIGSPGLGVGEGGSQGSVPGKSKGERPTGIQIKSGTFREEYVVRVKERLRAEGKGACWKHHQALASGFSHPGSHSAGPPAMHPAPWFEHCDSAASPLRETEYKG